MLLIIMMHGIMLLQVEDAEDLQYRRLQRLTVCHCHITANSLTQAEVMHGLRKLHMPNQEHIKAD